MLLKQSLLKHWDQGLPSYEYLLVQEKSWKYQIFKFYDFYTLLFLMYELICQLKHICDKKINYLVTLFLYNKEVVRYFMSFCILFECNKLTSIL